MERVDRLLQGLDRHQHVLDDVRLVVQLGDGGGLRQLQQRHLGRHQPAEQVAEHWVVAEGDDVLKNVI